MKKKLVEEHLLELDREFTRNTEKEGLEGWVRYFAEDGAMIPSQGPIIRGREAIRNAMEKSFSQTGYSLKWEPEYAEAAEDGTMGYTFGKYIRKTINAEGQSETATGRYTSIWRLQQDGSYKITLDMGN